MFCLWNSELYLKYSIFSTVKWERRGYGWFRELKVYERFSETTGIFMSLARDCLKGVEKS